MLALIWALQLFEVCTLVLEEADHNPPNFLCLLSCLAQRLMRWTLLLQSHGLEIKHSKSKDNIVTDALSRALVG